METRRNNYQLKMSMLCLLKRFVLDLWMRRGIGSDKSMWIGVGWIDVMIICFQKKITVL